MASPVAIDTAPGVSAGSATSRTPSGLVLRLRAWFRRPRLDAAIAGGLNGRGDPVLALREGQLVATRQRRLLAARLEEVLAMPARSRGLASTVPVDRWAVEDARPVLADLIDLLRSPKPVAPRGMVLGWRILTDPGSSLYKAEARGPSGDERLRRESFAVLEALRPA